MRTYRIVRGIDQSTSAETAKRFITARKAGRLVNEYRKTLSLSHGTVDAISRLRVKLSAPRPILVTFDRGKEFKVVVGGNLRDAISHLRGMIREHRKRTREIQPRGVRNQPGTVLDLLKQKQARRVYASKKPMLAEKHVGVEIECITQASQERLAVLLNEAELTQYVQLKSDGSVRTSSDRGGRAHELAVVAPERLISEVITKVCSILQDAGGYVNKSCGLHVHLDMRPETGRNPEPAFHNLRAAQALLFKMQPASRRSNSYCKPIRTKSLQDARARGDRYKGINTKSLRTHQTIELRMHSGTIDATKILNWIGILVRLVDAPALDKTPRSVAGLARAAGFPKSLADYMTARCKLFDSAATSSEDAATEADAA